MRNSFKTNRVIILLVVAFILLLALTACQMQPVYKGSAPAGSLWDGIPEPQNAEYQSDNSVQEGGLHAFYTTSQESGDFVDSYNQALESSGWTIVSTGGDPFGAFGGGSTATYSDGR